mmetsp:Transcript_6458/g.10853  ORF Transcript_6458/g.10853 Transcript_6458/m.10853 type:complete len:556 (+) Transcript_6458:31-1698(+)
MGNSSSSGGQSGNHQSSGGGSSSGGGLGNRFASAGGTHRVHLPISSLPSPFRSGGSLGLSKAELDARCQPSGLYPSCEWEPKQIRRLIGDGKLAARLKGADSCISKSDRECPICFMYYSETNISKCCNATVCTECYLQIKPQKDKHTTCPFCNNPKMAINVQRAMDEDDILKRDEEEQRVIEAAIRNRAAQKNGESSGLSDTSNDEPEGGATSFGSSLENYNRSRTFSNASSSNVSANSSEPGTPTNDSNALLSVAMTPEDRRALEDEMRAQLSHETHRRMRSEEEEASMRRAQEWYGSEAGTRARMRDNRLAELSELLERMSGRGGGSDDEDEEGGAIGRGREAATLGSLIRAMERSGRGPDLMRLEAAFLLGMDGDIRRQRNQNSSSRNSTRSGNDGLAAGFGFSDQGRPGGPPRRVQVRGAGRGISTTHLDTAELYMRGVSEEEQLAMAIAMSMQDQQQSQHEGEQEASTNNSATETDEDAQRSENQSSHTEESAEEESSSESSGETEDEDEEEESVGEETDDIIANVNAPSSNDVGTGSLDEDEEEVVFIG